LIKTRILQLIGSLTTLISPRLNTEIMYFLYFKKRINLKNPQTLDEKIQWLKLNTYYNNELVKKCADKYKVIDYIKEKGCEEILNERIGVYDCVENIPWQDLPFKFVVKWNFGSGFNIICQDKDLLDINKVSKQLEKWGKRKYYLRFSEMQYKGVEEKILIERFIESPSGNIPEDYKVYCFNGKAYYVLVCLDRGSEQTKFYFFDRNWHLQRFNKMGKEAPEDFSIPKPEGVDELFKYADILAEPFPFVRVDFFLVNGKVYFGELTFTPGGGYDKNRLPKTNLLFGEILKLPI